MKPATAFTPALALFDSDPARPPRLQLSHPFARIVLGGSIAIAFAVLSAGALVFGPLSDLSVLQFAAGPNAQGPSTAPAAPALSRTGRSWGATAQQRQAAAEDPPGGGWRFLPPGAQFLHPLPLGGS